MKNSKVTSFKDFVNNRFRTECEKFFIGYISSDVESIDFYFKPLDFYKFIKKLENENNLVVSDLGDYFSHDGLECTDSISLVDGLCENYLTSIDKFLVDNMEEFSSLHSALYWTGGYSDSIYLKYVMSLSKEKNKVILDLDYYGNIFYDNYINDSDKSLS